MSNAILLVEQGDKSTPFSALLGLSSVHPASLEVRLQDGTCEVYLATSQALRNRRNCEQKDGKGLLVNCRA